MLYYRANRLSERRRSFIPDGCTREMIYWVPIGDQEKETSSFMTWVLSSVYNGKNTFKWTNDVDNGYNNPLVACYRRWSSDTVVYDDVHRTQVRVCIINGGSESGYGHCDWYSVYGVFNGISTVKHITARDADEPLSTVFIDQMELVKCQHATDSKDHINRLRKLIDNFDECELDIKLMANGGCPICNNAITIQPVPPIPQITINGVNSVDEVNQVDIWVLDIWVPCYFFNNVQV